MENIPYLIFSVKGALYGVEALSVKEIFLLPEVTAIAETPLDIVGVVNLRGDILAIVDLNVRLGYTPEEYSLTDSIIVVESSNLLVSDEKNARDKIGRVGIIVNQVFEVKNIPESAITTDIYYGGEGVLTEEKIAQESTGHPTRFVRGVAKVDEDIVMLLESEYLINAWEKVDEKSDRINFSQPQAVLEKSAEQFEETESWELNFPANRKKATNLKTLEFCPQATPEERAIFRQRAKNLMEVTLGEDFTGLMPLAVIGLNDEYFGIDLEIVREFTDVDKISPVPCTPAHIVGNMNLRGEIVTLVDIRGALNMPMTRAENPSKAMIIEVIDMVAGAIVDEVFDVMYLNPSEIKVIPTAVHSTNGHDEYAIGTANYRQKMMTIVDLPKIMLQGGLVVEEYI